MICHHCVLSSKGVCLKEGMVQSTPEAFSKHFVVLKSSLTAIEVGLHSRWASHILPDCGHEAIVPNPASLRQICAFRVVPLPQAPRGSLPHRTVAGEKLAMNTTFRATKASHFLSRTGRRTQMFRAVRRSAEAGRLNQRNTYPLAGNQSAISGEWQL
jgi:hypothetical protein